MFQGHAILIVEDETLIALNLADEIAALAGHVVGPTPTVTGALAILRDAKVTAAILDANLLDRDVTPVALELAERGVPFVIHSAIGIPAALADAVPEVRLVRKPAMADEVFAELMQEISSVKGKARDG
jgi:DNA-binding NtrC family response regulator